MQKPSLASGSEPALGGRRRVHIDPQHLVDLLGSGGAEAWRRSVDFVLDNSQVRGYAVKLVAVIAATHQERQLYSMDHRIYATRALEAFGDEVATQALVDLLADRTAWWLGQYAMDALAAIGAAATSYLIPALGHYDPVVRRRAAQTMGDIRDHQAIDALMQRYEIEPEPWVRACIVRALGAFQYRAQVQTLLQQATSDGDRLVRQYAHESLAQM